MNLTGNTVLITGGSNGIGLALAERFISNKNQVIICGRDQKKLDLVKEKYPQIIIKRCDVEFEEQRIELFNWATKEFYNINILINNAGIQQRLSLKEAKWKTCKREIAINLEAPIHLSTMFIHHLLKQTSPFIINVTSGLAFMPPVWVPVYGTTKAGLHSFTFSLRQQLADTNIGVIEVIPPAVNTDLGGKGLHTFGADIDAFGDAIFQGFEDRLTEIGFDGNLEMTNKIRPEIEDQANQIWKKMSAK